MSTAGGGAGRFAFRMKAEFGLEGAEADALWDHGCRGVVEEEDSLVGYFDEIVDLPFEGSWQELEDQDYLERYYRELECVTVGPLVIAPTHRNAVLSAGQKPLWIDPGMAFGTGHHETTRLAIAALAAARPLGKRVIDVGAGSGILAIAADLLGAAGAKGVDIDLDTIEIARGNASLNSSRAVFEHRSLEEHDRADLLVANLFAELHVELVNSYARALGPGGRLLLTGILADRMQLVEEAIRGAFESLDWQADGEWRLLSATRVAGSARR